MNVIPDPGEWSLGVGCAISLCLVLLLYFSCGLVLSESPGWIQTNENIHDVGPFFLLKDEDVMIVSVVGILVMDIAI